MEAWSQEPHGVEVQPSGIGWKRSLPGAQRSPRAGFHPPGGSQQLLEKASRCPCFAESTGASEQRHVVTGPRPGAQPEWSPGLALPAHPVLHVGKLRLRRGM